MMRDTFSFIWTTVPGNSEFVVPFDSTRMGRLSTASLATGSAFLAPGSDRGMFEKYALVWSCATTGQNVTLNEQNLKGNAGTSADWITQGTGAVGTYTITAGAANPTTGEFTSDTADFRILITAGATGPTTLIFRATLWRTFDRGA